MPAVLDVLVGIPKYFKGSTEGVGVVSSEVVGADSPCLLWVGPCSLEHLAH